MTDYQIFFLIVAVFVVAYLLGTREGKDHGERAARFDEAQRRWEEKKRAGEEEADREIEERHRLGHLSDEELRRLGLPPKRDLRDPRTGGSEWVPEEVIETEDGRRLTRGFNPRHWD